MFFGMKTPFSIMLNRLFLLGRKDRSAPRPKGFERLIFYSTERLIFYQTEKLVFYSAEKVQFPLSSGLDCSPSEEIGF